MPRSARFIIPGYPFHITHRGNNKQKIFQTDEDRRRYLYLFEEAKRKYGMKILSYCLMNNHVHFIALAENGMSFAKTINTAHTRYAQYFNKKNGMVGHLWQGRYYSCILDYTHMLAAMRYVERNPVRASLVANPWEWVWSSAREHLKLEGQGIISLESMASFVSIDSWQEFIHADDRGEDLIEIRKQTLSLRAWGEDSFKELIEKEFGKKLRFGLKGRPRLEKIGTSTIF